MRLAPPPGQFAALAVAVAFLALVGLSLTPPTAHSYSSGAPPAFSGPEQYCNACHGGPMNEVNSGPGSVTISAPDTFVPGEPVAVTVTLTPADVPNPKQGFELSARDAALDNVGSFNVDGTTVQFAQGDPDWVTHTFASNEETSWSFEWVPPATGAPDEVTLYVAGNAADGNGAPGAGDEIYAAEHVLTQATVPDVVAAMAPLNPPVVVGPGGGTIRYTVSLTNTTGQSQTVDAWTDAVLPNGNPYGPVEGPRVVRLGAGQTLGPLTLSLRVPGAAPAGSYTYRLRLGDYPSDIASEATFTFEKQAGSSAAGPFALSGDGAFLAEASAAPTGARLSAASPNPFTTEARLTLTMPSAAAVRAEVLDVRGRRVALLHDGPLGAGAHALTLDGRGLPGGVYLVRVTGQSVSVSRRVTLVR